MIIKGNVTITIADYEAIKEEIAKLETENKRLERILREPKVVEALHQSE